MKIKNVIKMNQVGVFEEDKKVFIKDELIEFKKGTTIMYDNFNNLFVDHILVPDIVYGAIRKCLNVIKADNSIKNYEKKVRYYIKTPKEVKGEGFSVLIPEILDEDVLEMNAKELIKIRLSQPGNYSCRKKAAIACHNVNKDIFNKMIA